MTSDRRSGSAPAACADAESTGCGNRRLVKLAAVATILPMWIAAVRVGLRGFIPVGDTAIMALRAPDMVSAHPALIGMPASSASSASHVVHFLGPWELWWLALPVKALGPTWGTVLAMAALNSLWILLAFWLVCRNLRTPSALVVIAFIGAFCWSIGNGMLIDSWPLRMVLVPFLVTVVAAWFTGMGDPRALVVLAGVASFAFLDHLVLAAAVPIVAVAGCAGLIVSHVIENRSDPTRIDERRRVLRNGVLGAASVTAVLWLPTIIQQLTHSPGNLGLLVAGSPDGHPSVGSWSAAVHVMAGLIGHPPFWLRGTLNDPTFFRAHATGFAGGSVTWADVGVVVVFATAFAVARPFVHTVAAIAPRSCCSQQRARRSLRAW